MRILSELKLFFVPKDVKPRTIRFGLCKGLKMNLGLRSQMQLYLGLWERETYKWLRQLSEDANTAIDVGAGIGEQTLFFLAKTKAQKIFSFEPLKDIHEKYFANMKLNDHHHSPRLVFSSKYVGSVNNENTIVLDSLLDSIVTPCLVKIDTDGGELAILQGAKKLLELKGVRWLIETHSRQLESGCITILSQAEYTTKIIPQAWWRVIIPEERPLGFNRWLVAYKK